MQGHLFLCLLTNGFIWHVGSRYHTLKICWNGECRFSPETSIGKNYIYDKELTIQSANFNYSNSVQDQTDLEIWNFLQAKLLLQTQIIVFENTSLKLLKESLTHQLYLNGFILIHPVYTLQKARGRQIDGCPILNNKIMSAKINNMPYNISNSTQ